MAELYKKFNFVEKLWQVVEESDCYGAVRWGPRGAGIILNSGGFWRLSLEINKEKNNQWPFPNRTSQWLIRQLRLHNFYKCKNTSNLYFHSFFIRARPDLLHFIKRKEDPQTNFQMKIDEKAPGLMLTTARELLKLALECALRTQPNSIENLNIEKSPNSNVQDMTIMNDSSVQNLNEVVNPKNNCCTITSFEDFAAYLNDNLSSPNIANVQYSISQLEEPQC